MTNPIYEPKGRAKEYCDLAVNVYTGCNHGCYYCYARKMAERYTSKDCICAFNEPRPRPAIVESVKRQLARGKIKGRTIQLCFSCDPYPAEIDTMPTREVIEAIKNSGNHVQILTKGGYRAERDFDLLDSEDWFGVTISGNEAQMKINEPNAASRNERLDSLIYAKTVFGLKTWVSLEPVFSTLEVYGLIEGVPIIDLYKIGKLNYEPSAINWAEFGRECERLCLKHGRDYYIKADLRAEMEARP